MIGLAKSVVEGALTKVQSAIEEDEKLRQRAQSNLAFMTVEFEMMQSFLDVANKESGNNKLVATWVRHVRKVAYDVQDCIELVIHMDDRPSWWHRLLPTCSGEPLLLDQAVAEIEQLKARVEDVSKCYTRYNLINDSGSKLVMLQPPASRATAVNMLMEARHATQRQQGLGDLTQLITKRNNDFQVISVWGAIGDHGTTSIIRKAYNNPDICRSFTCRAWVKLVHPFNPDKFARSFMAQFYANSSQAQGGSVGVEVRRKMKANQEDLLNEFMQQVNRKRYLIVLENLSNMVDWDAIRTFLPDKKDGSRIIVSTQQSEVASLCVGHSYQLLELKQFSPEHSVCVFFEKGSQGQASRDKGKDNKGGTSKGSSDHLSSDDKMEAARDWMLNHALVERGSELTELRKYIAMVRINSSQVTSVWGMPGVGKSAIVRTLYYDKMLGSDQFVKYGWVDVSHPFNLRDFSGSLLLGFHSESHQSKDAAYRVAMGITDPIEECRKFLSNYRCLVVINNLQSTEEWDSIENNLVSRPSTSVIIVVTTEARIAAHCAHNKEDILNVKGLEADAAYSLFKKEVQKKSQSDSLPIRDLPADLQKRYCLFDGKLKELILRCGGLPMVITAIAGSLGTDLTESKWKDSIASLNEGFMKELEKKAHFDSLRGLFSWMHSYVGNCPDILKPCILYMSIFPPNQCIRRRRLVRRWISEGYSKENDNRSLEEYGEELFSMLVNMSIIQQPPQSVTTASDDTRMVLCQVNRFLYEYIISRRKEENLVFQLGHGRNLSTQCTWHHLTIWKEWNRDQVVFESINLSRLRSLTVFGEWKPFFISKSMKLVRVLDLENATGVKDDDLENMVKLLRRLKFLSLRGCREICNLPSSIGDLRQLQSLDIRHTTIVALPGNITKLQKLQYIRAGTIVQAEQPSTPYLSVCRVPGICGRRRLVGAKVPRGFGKLTALHTLGVVNVGASACKGVLRQLKKLTQLHKLGVSGINRKNSRKFFAAISGHRHLESLSVRLQRGSQGCLDDISLPWENLQSLKLYGLEDKLPLSRPRLPEDHLPQDVVSNQVTKLTKLVLQMDILKPRGIKFLAELPNLCILRLRVKQPSLHFFVKLTGHELPIYEKVKILEIACSSRLRVTFGSKAMQNLELLKLDFSSGSPTYQLSGLNHLCQLKEVFLKGSNDETQKTGLQTQLENHPYKPIVKLEE